MRDLVGAACGTQNPLVQLSQQVRGDAARQQDGLGARMSGPGPSHQAPGTFQMSALLQDMRGIDNGHRESQWAREFQSPPSNLFSEWSRDFQNFPQQSPQPESLRNVTAQFSQLNLSQTERLQNLLQQYPHLSTQPEALRNLQKQFPQLNLSQPDHLQNLLQQQPHLSSPTVLPQPGTSQGLFLNRPFMQSMHGFNTQPLGLQIAAGCSTKWAEDILTQSEQKQSELAEVASGYVKTENNADVQQTNFFKFVENVANQAQTESASEQAPPQQAEDSKDDTKFWQDVTKSWTSASFNTFSEQWGKDQEILPLSYREYKFNEQTPIDENLVRNPFEEGLEKLRQGDLPSAVLLFEAAVKKDSNHVEAWQYLGTTQAQNEQDVQAIAALRQCISLDPQNLVALLSLGVSYHNEGLQRQGCEALREWLRVNPKYTHLVAGQQLPLGQGNNITTMEKEMHKEITEMFIRAAQIQPENPDADVQSGLGVLLNMSFDFDKAIDCFKAAVSVRPDDARLWNRLGATLANGGRSAEAVEAYRHALQLYPGYIRARFNLGISCINLNCYDEAAEHFLSALNLQNNATADDLAMSQQATMSNNIWNTLRMCITLMNRPELYKFVEARDLKELSRMFLKA